MARPTKYKAEFCGPVKKMCQLGAVDADIAEALEIDLATLYRWRHKHPAFCEALSVGKSPADDRVEAALYHRAVGYSHPDVHISNYLGEITKTPIIKHYPPDTKAALAWLYNRRAESWHPMPTGESSSDLAAALEKLADKLPGA